MTAFPEMAYSRIVECLDHLEGWGKSGRNRATKGVDRWYKYGRHEIGRITIQKGFTLFYGFWSGTGKGLKGIPLPGTLLKAEGISLNLAA